LFHKHNPTCFLEETSMTLTPDIIDRVTSRLRTANRAFTAQYPGDSGNRQPVHTVYGGAQIFKADTAMKLGANALRALEDYAPDFVSFARAIRLRGSERLPASPSQVKALAAKLRRNVAAVKSTNEEAWLAHTVYERVIAKLRTEPVEDFRIDFEDGYGNRPDPEEDGHAAFTAGQVAMGMKEGTLPPFIGIRIKPFTEELKARSIRTLDS
jgi:hypothetical protein